MRELALVFVVAGTVCMPAHAGEYFAARIDGQILTISSRHRGEIDAPTTEKDQAGFTDVKISEDGNTVGWVTLEYAGASYPYPVALVLFRNGKVVQNFVEFGIDNGWTFVGNDSVIISRTFPHGPELFGFFHRRISDGALLGEYKCGYVYGPNGYELMDADPVPKWATSFAEECPSGVNGDAE